MEILNKPLNYLLETKCALLHKSTLNLVLHFSILKLNFVYFFSYLIQLIIQATTSTYLYIPFTNAILNSNIIMSFHPLMIHSPVCSKFKFLISIERMVSNPSIFAKVNLVTMFNVPPNIWKKNLFHNSQTITEGRPYRHILDSNK